MPLIIENPVSRPIVPPIADSISTNLEALSIVTKPTVGESKKILTYRSLFFHSCKQLTIRCFTISLGLALFKYYKI